jgi:hypothetical protein
MLTRRRLSQYTNLNSDKHLISNKSESRLRTPVLDSRIPNPEYDYGWISGGAV